MIDDTQENVPSNLSGNRPFDHVLGARISRRSVLGGGATGLAAFFIGGSFGAKQTAAAADDATMNLGFTAIPTSSADIVSVPDGYVAQPFLAWGEPINGRFPRFEQDASNPAEHQERQIGQGHDGMWFFPLGPNGDSNRRGLMVVNHEYTLGDLTFPDGYANWDAVKTRKEQAGHGVSVVEIVRKTNGQWQIAPSTRARRITPKTKMEMTGPAAGHRLLQTDKDSTGRWPRGTVNNCGNGVTPWGTYVTCEENFNGYFWEESNGTAPAITTEQAGMNARYGVGGQGFGYLWATTDEWFRADLDPHQPNTYGWIVEIDPFSVASAPKKRTALGRFKHEGAAFLTAVSGQVVCYMGDDERFDYIYKYVSTRPWAEDIAAGRSPLDDGTLFVARFDDDGTGEWLPLVHGTGPLVAENGFADQGDVLIKARLAGDALGATPMDRPEWTTTNPTTGDVFVTLTNNTRRTEAQVDAANPRANNAYGHIIKWNEGADPAAATFNWEIFLLAGGGVGAGDGSTIDDDDQFGSPDCIWLDPHGVLWIATDGSQPDGSNNQLLACDPETAEIKRFAVGPADCEVTGLTATPDGTTLFFNIQHPGEGSTSDAPTARSTWPDGDQAGRPRAATVAVSRLDGGRVGT